MEVAVDDSLWAADVAVSEVKLTYIHLRSITAGLPKEHGPN